MQHVTPPEFVNAESRLSYKHGTPNGVCRKRCNDRAEFFLNVMWRRPTSPALFVMPNCEISDLAISDCEIRGTTGKSDFAMLCGIEILFAANAFVQT